MLKNNNMISLSDRFNKYKCKKYHKKSSTQEAFFILKRKKKDYELFNKDNKSTDCFAKTATVFVLEKLKDKQNRIIKNQLNSINKLNINEKNNKRTIYNINNEKNQKIRKIILAKKKMIEQILHDEGKIHAKEKKIFNFYNNNNNICKLNNRRNNRVILINSISMPEIEINKKSKNGIEEFCDNVSLIKNQDNKTKNIIQDKLYHINMNKIALFKKIKFEGLKKYCNKDLKLNNGNNNSIKNDLNFITHHNNKNIHINKSWNKNCYVNSNHINNCNEITINSIREKVKSYFIGKFDNIKDFFDDWDEQGIGKITINNVYRYLNNKINFKISKEETKKLIAYYSKKNYFDLQNFKYFFFEEPSNEKLSIKVSKLLTNKLNENLQFHKNKNNINILCYEKYKYNKLLNAIKEHKDKILSEKIVESDKKEEELNYNDFNTLINNIIIDDKKINYSKEIKKLFMNYKTKDSTKINIKDFIEKINDKSNISKNLFYIYQNSNSNNNIYKGNTTNAIFKNIKKKINSCESNSTNLTNSNWNSKNDFIKKDTILNHTLFNMKKSFSKKENIFSQTNYIFKNNKEFEDNIINKYYKAKNNTNNIKESKSQDMKMIKKKTSIKNIRMKTINRDKYFKNKLTITNENIHKKSKIMQFHLPKMPNIIRVQNKNSDIIDLL